MMRYHNKPVGTSSSVSYHSKLHTRHHIRREELELRVVKLANQHKVIGNIPQSVNTAGCCITPLLSSPKYAETKALSDFTDQQVQRCKLILY